MMGQKCSLDCCVVYVLCYYQLMRKKSKYILALVLIVSACGGGTGFSEDYPNEAKDNFIEACLGEGGGRDSCECALDAFTQNIDYGTFKIMDAAIRIGLPEPFEGVPELEAALEKCYE